MKRVKEKVMLFRWHGTEWKAIESGYLNPNPPEVGKTVWVGSISSREGWTTTEVVEVKEIDKGIEFKTKNSTYRVLPLRCVP